MSEQDGRQVSTLQPPTTNNPEAWKAYWKAQSQPWRTEPEIDRERQMYLVGRRAITPDIEKGIYPFKSIKLNRADVEWLLATLENGRGPVDWNDESQRGRTGLDLRSADLRDVDLNNLPLAQLKAGLVGKEWSDANNEQRVQARVLMQGANLRQAELEGASLVGAQLEGADLYRAQLEGADLYGAQLKGANLYRAQLKGANLSFAQLKGANLRQAQLERTHLADVIFSNERRIGPRLADVQWDTNLAIVDWSQMTKLGDEWEAEQKKTSDGQKKEPQRRLRKYQVAVRANRQLSMALQAQGLNEDAARFAYRGQILQRKVFWYQRKSGQYLFSLFLDLLAGYGYRPGRSVSWYLVIIVGFSLAYYLLGHLPLLPDAFVFSLTSFHGRGFFPGLGNETSLHSPLVVLAAAEAVIGLFIEISFIATFTKKFFGS